MKKTLLILAISFTLSILVFGSCKTVQDCPAYGSVEQNDIIEENII